MGPTEIEPNFYEPKLLQSLLLEPSTVGLPSCSILWHCSRTQNHPCGVVCDLATPGMRHGEQDFYEGCQFHFRIGKRVAARVWAEAARLWERAACGHRHPGALAMLSLCYGQGMGVRINLTMAHKLAEDSEHLGSAVGRLYCGMLRAGPWCRGLPFFDKGSGERMIKEVCVAGE